MVIQLNQVKKRLLFTVVILRQLNAEVWVLETEKHKLLYRALFFFFHLKKTVLINLVESRPWKKRKNMYRSQIYPWKVLYITLLLLLHNVVLVECNLFHSNLFLSYCHTESWNHFCHSKEVEDQYWSSPISWYNLL